MKILVNDNEMILKESINVNELIKTLELKVEKIAVEINKMIIPRSEYDIYCMKDNDKVEIINAVGGG